MRQSVAVIDYGSGNLRSVAKALERAVADHDVQATVNITSLADQIRQADRIVLPGVGAFADCMAGLRAIPGMQDALTDAVMVRFVPFLGICVGMQLLATEGHEHGVHQGLGWIPGKVTRLSPSDPRLKVPQMGWNNIRPLTPHPLLQPFKDRPDTYFVHSYAMVPQNPHHMLADCDYGGPVAAMVGRDNIVGTQFHPEKSQATGLAFLAAFLNWRP